LLIVEISVPLVLGVTGTHITTINDY